jgi:hypothetical protein
MKNWLTSLFLLFSLAGGVFAGMPLHSGNANSQMKCCKKMKSAEQQQMPQMNMVRLCCVMNCSDTAPTNSSGASFNFSPSAIIISDSILKQIAALFPIKEEPISAAQFSHEREILPRRIPPKYVQHHSFLI